MKALAYVWIALTATRVAFLLTDQPDAATAIGFLSHALAALFVFDYLIADR